MNTLYQSQLEDPKGGTGWGQSNRMEAAGKDEYSTSDERKPAADQCPGKDDGNWHDIWRIGEADGYRRGMCQGEVLWMWPTWALQTGLSQMRQNKGRGITMPELLLGSCSNEQENGLKD